MRKRFTETQIIGFLKERMAVSRLSTSRRLWVHSRRIRDSRQVPSQSPVAAIRVS